MTYGEIQAVVQLSVGINIGILALRELSLPYLNRQREDLRSLRAYMGEVKQEIDGIQSPPKRDEKEKQFAALTARMMRVWSRSTEIRKRLDKFIISMSIAAGIGAFTGLIMLFHTASSYAEKFPDAYWYVLVTFFAPLVVGVVINLYARSLGYGNFREQRSIRQALSTLLETSRR